MADGIESVRNIGIMAHIDAGKTTVSERILYYSGKTYKIGEVHEGTAVMDFLEEEQERGITITSAATKCPWKGHTINLIDTPGHIDFTAEVERSLRVLDGAVAVFDASEGVQAQSETVWRQGKKYDLSCLCFINKMDKVGADFEMAVQSIREKLLAHPVPVEMPIGEGDRFEGVIDLVTMKALYHDPESLGARVEERPIPEALHDRAAEYRSRLLEAAAEFDDALMEAFLEDREVDVDQLQRAIRRGVLENRIHPVFLGAALKNIGVQRLMDGVIAYLPSPLDRPTIEGHHPDRPEETIPVHCDPDGPLVALAFKITGDAHGDLCFLRLYRGRLKSGTRVLNATQAKKENITRLFEMHANERRAIDQAQAGDIVAVVGLKQTLTGDTICDSRRPAMLPRISFPEAVITLSIEPRSAADKARLSEALDALRREDPTFLYRIDKETGQTVISGMGELHLEVIQHKLIKERKVNVRVGTPRVAYKETITEVAQAEARFERQTGGHGQFAQVLLRVEPLREPDENTIGGFAFVNETTFEEVPKEFVPAVERGAKEALSCGVLAGYPVVGVRVVLAGGAHHVVDSSELAFEQAAAIALEKALKQASPVLLEPVMRVQVITPDANFGPVQANLLGRRATITDCTMHGQMRVIDARVPLVEMFGYSSDIRSLTAGRGSFTMEPESYEQVPEQVAARVIM